jgi:hypothetical protein
MVSVGQASNEMAQPVNLWRWVKSPTGKPLALGEKLYHPSFTTLPAMKQALAGIALALGECKMQCWLDMKTTKSFNIGLMAEAVGDVVGGYQWLKSRQR